MPCDSPTTLCAVSKLRLHTILTLLLALQTSLGQFLRAGMLRSHFLDDLFDHVNLQPTLFSETVSMVSVQTFRAEYALGLDRSPAEPAWTARDRLFLDRPISFESLVCQLLLIVTQLSWHPFLSVSSAPSGV